MPAGSATEIEALADGPFALSSLFFESLALSVLLLLEKTWISGSSAFVISSPTMSNCNSRAPLMILKLSVIPQHDIRIYQDHSDLDKMRSCGGFLGSYCT